MQEEKNFSDISMNKKSKVWFFISMTFFVLGVVILPIGLSAIFWLLPQTAELMSYNINNIIFLSYRLPIILAILSVFLFSVCLFIYRKDNRKIFIFSIILLILSLTFAVAKTLSWNLLTSQGEKNLNNFMNDFDENYPFLNSYIQE